MKTTFASAWVALLVVLPAATHAQYYYNHCSQPEDAMLDGSCEMPSVIYEAPVTYFGPVVYQAPVVYYAPVYYVSQPPLLVDAVPPDDVPLSTVFVIGVAGGPYGYGHFGSTCETVIPFGERGGWFGGWW